MTDTFVAEVEETVDAYLKRSYDSQRRHALTRCQGWDRTFLDEIADLGWFALAVPDKAAGLGLPLSAVGAAMVSLGRHLVPGPMPERLLLPALLLRHLDDGGSGRSDLSGAVVALVDPAAHGSWSVDGGHVRGEPAGLAGSMLPVRFAREADLLLVVAESAEGTAVHLLSSRGPGVDVEPVESADPTARLARVTFAEPAGAGTAPVLTGSAAERFVAELRAWAQILAACELAGIAVRMVEETTAFVQVRKQFGRPIGAFQAVKHTLADMYALASSLRNLCDVTLEDATSSSADELLVLAAVAKAYAADAAVRVCESAIQMHGGTGFTTETDLHLYYKRALALRAWYGDHEELTHRIGDSLLTGSQLAEPRSTS
ncbi:acyl-CoA dehydrogenase family protein [Pseudonocardia yuanmonensis]|uniref:Acyl-CoA dehydrogenase family protein n=1 Tax=Pseudonocardia yuanmonensis TaxID=1095914 RepID=A0ABP8XMT8_9PSEU